MSTNPHRAHGLADVRTVAVPVADQDAALAFWTGSVGFEVRMDATSPALRWLTVAPAGGAVCLALVAPGTAGATGPGVDTGIRFGVSDAAATHTGLAGAGVAVGELLTWPGVPPMFDVVDPDGNRFYVTEESR